MRIGGGLERIIVRDFKNRLNLSGGTSGVIQLK